MVSGLVLTVLFTCLLLLAEIAGFSPTLVLACATFPAAFLYAFSLLEYKRYLLVPLALIILIAVGVGGYLGVRAALYVFFDLLAITINLSFLNAEKPIRLSEISRFSTTLYYYFWIYLFFYFFQLESDGDRYPGPLLNVNLSAYVFGYASIFMLIKLIGKSGIGGILTVAGCILSAVFFVASISGSRSIMFFVIAIFAIVLDIIWRRCSRLAAFLILLLVVVAGVAIISVWIGGERFDSEETSFLTRKLISEDLIGKLIDAKGFPQGPRFSVDYIVNEYGNPDMHPHNDFLVGVLDYGFLYAILIVMICRAWFRRFGANLVAIVLLVLYFSTALHGYFSSLLLLFPAFLFSEYYKRWRLIGQF